MFYVACNSFNHLTATASVSVFKKKKSSYLNFKKSISKCNKRIIYKSLENSPTRRKTQSIPSTNFVVVVDATTRRQTLSH